MAEGVKEKSGQKYSKAGRRTNAGVCGGSSGRTRGSRVSSPVWSRPKHAVAPGGARGTDARDSPPGPAFGSRRFQAAPIISC